MQLFAEQLGEVLRALGDTRAPKRRAEKRTFFRIGARYRITLRHGSLALEAWLRDVSSSGVGILLSQARSSPPLGATVGLELPRRDGSVVVIMCVVRNASQISPGTHQLGAAFVLPIDELRDALSLLCAVVRSA